MDDLNLKELDEAFFNDGYAIAQKVLGSGITRMSVIHMAREIYEYMDGFTNEFLKHCDNQKMQIDCKKGCAHCCHQSVFALPHETLYLYTYLKTLGDKPFFESVKNKVLHKDAITSKMQLKEVISNSEPCPFLENSVCTVYEARPMSCRLFQSMDVQSCINERNNPSDFVKFARLYDIPLRAGRMLNEGVCAYFTEKGLKTTEWILESSMTLIFMSDEVIKNWLNGEESFKRRDLTDDEWKLLKRYDGNLD